MHIIKSPFPNPPELPEVNAHYTFLKRPDQAEWPDFTLLIDPVSEKKRTFREFVSHVQDAATALGAPVSEGGLGLRGEDGDIVGIMSENSMDYLTLVHSCLMITTPFALISSYSTNFELKHALTLSRVTRLFVDPKFLPAVLAVAKEIGLPSNKIYAMNSSVKGRHSLSKMIHNVRKKLIPPVEVREATRDTLAYLVFSSGTSGLPKAVMISHGNIIYSIAQVMVIAQANAEVYVPPPPKTPEGVPVALAFLPLHHTYGLHAYCFRYFLTPGTLVILSKWNLSTALQAIPKYKVTHLALIPSVVHQIVNYPNIHKVDFSSIMAMGSGAAYLPPELAKKLEKLAPKDASFAEGYGMSECTIAAISQPYPGTLGGKMKRILGSTGVLLPGMKARLVGDDGADVGINEIGELWLRSPNVAIGYFNNEKANKETFVDGWLHTGDKFRMDEEGYFYFADRAKDTLKVSGSQVSPVEIENVLLQHPKGLVGDVTVAGVSGHGRTSDEKVPRAWIVLSDSGKKLGAAAVIKELESWHQENLSKYKWLRGGIEIVKEIPKSPTGKVLRRVLQDKYEKNASKKVKGKL